MTDVTYTANTRADDAGELSSVIQRRLVGLVVLLAGLFLVSLMLRNASPSSEVLPSVVIPLSHSGTGALRQAASAEPDPVQATRNEEVVSSKPLVEAPAPTLPLAQEPAAAVAPDRRQVETLKSKVEPALPKPQVAAKPAAAKPAVTKPAVTKPEAPPRWFVAVGAYKDPMAAQAIANRVKLAGFKAEVSAVTVNKDRLQRVRAGPFASKSAAESARVTLIVEGLTKAVTLSEK